MSEATLPACASCGGQQIGNLEVISQQAVGLHPADIREEAQKKPQDFLW
ncbi:hypothetical protein ACXJJ3_37150 [Kribbella sp. WER1]